MSPPDPGRRRTTRRPSGARPLSRKVKVRLVAAAVAAGAVLAAGSAVAGHNPLGFIPLAAGTNAAGFGHAAHPGDTGADAARTGQGAGTPRLDSMQGDSGRPLYVKPAQGTFTAGFEGRWGTFHYGVDIANRIGTPIYAVTNGLVVEAGPASGFGQLIRVQLSDGTMNVYGHVDTILAHTGQRVRAGDQIATMGNGGFSAGPRLYFEVWNPEGKKIDPVPWFAERGIYL